ncbi:MAG: MBL fold metallo-hydrolase [Candidatus Aenigmatarchaeota archaeon]
MIQLSFNGALSTVGCSAVLVDTGIEKILLDYGTKVKEVPPQFPIPIQGKPDAILLSHSHLDHSGAIAIFSANGQGCPIYSINVTKPLTELLLLDSIKVSHEEGVSLPFSKKDVHETIKNFISIPYRQKIKLKKTSFTFLDAGHIPGSAMVLLDFKDKNLLYTGDFKTTDTRLLKRAELDLDKVDYLITESTYSDREHPDRKSQEKELIKIIEETLAVDGHCLIAGFAVGRLQEILLVLDKHGIDYPVYLDGMAKKATTIINQYKNLLREPESLDRALDKVEYITSSRQRKRILKNPCVILTTSGMLNGGPVVWYLKKLYSDERSSLILTGWQLEDTPGKILLETGRFITKDVNLEVKMFVKRLDFSAHAGRSELFSFVKKLNPEKVFCIHGDHTEEFALELRERGFDAVAPLANNRIFDLL